MSSRSTSNEQHNNRSQAGLGSAERRVLSKLAQLPSMTVTITTLKQYCHLSHGQAKLMLSRLCRKGWLQRVKTGVYLPIELSAPTINPMPADPQALAMELFAPAFLSGWTAAEYWGFTEQIFQKILVCTTVPQGKANQAIAGVDYQVRKVDPGMYFGLKTVWSGHRKIQITDPHRTVLDILASPSLGGGGRLAVQICRAYFQSKQCDFEQLFNYAKRLKKGVIFKRLGFLAEQLATPSPSWLEACQAHLSTGISLLDPNAPDQGSIVTRWRLKINLPPEDLL